MLLISINIFFLLGVIASLIWIFYDARREGLGMNKCQKCGGNKDLSKFTVKNVEKVLCVECRGQMFGKRISTKGWAKED